MYGELIKSLLTYSEEPFSKDCAKVLDDPLFYGRSGVEDWPLTVKFIWGIHRVMN